MAMNDDVVQAMVRLRREVHRHPELSHDEVRTTAAVRRELAAFGVENVRSLHFSHPAAPPFRATGLVVDIHGGSPGPVVAVRGDMDALPLVEDTGLPFASTSPGVMHACGHDVHTAMAFGVAVTANEHRHMLPGVLRVVFQPAEEAEPLGGRTVVEAGHLDDVNAVVALHVTPELDTGTIGLRAGPAMASSDEFTITIAGSSTHAGWPQRGADALLAGTAVVQVIQQIVSRRTDPLTSLVVNVGTIEAGTAPNIVADRAVIRGTVRALDESTRSEVHRLLAECAESTCQAHGCTASVEITRGEPVLVNAPDVADTFANLDPSVDVVRLELPTMNSEDFAFYAERVPAAMAWLGVRNAAKNCTYPLHHPRFAVDEDAIPVGAEALYVAATRLLEGTNGTAQPTLHTR